MLKLYRKVFEGLPFGALLLKLVPNSGGLEKWIVFDMNDRARAHVLELLHIDLHLCEGERVQDVLEDLEDLIKTTEITRAAEAGDQVEIDPYTISPITRDLVCLSFKN
jgi:hypothetical protein